MQSPETYEVPGVRPRNQRITIFDTTLRDGEQAPGFTLDVDEKVRMAAALVRLRVDVVEAGFPASSPVDFEGVQRVAALLARHADGPIPCALARCHDRDIDRAGEALSVAPRRRIHVFVATSDLHLSAKLGIGRDEAIDRVRAGIRRVLRYTDDVEFSAEDATRTDPEYLLRVVRVAAEEGARTINLPDTVGYATPDGIARMIEGARGALVGHDGVALSVHCHNDLGLATANSLAAVKAGATQVECTVNGIGERAGNAAMEEVVMALRTRVDVYGADTGIDTKAISDTSKLLAAITGIGPAPNKAVVGANAFAHEAGIHQHGMLADRRTYEIMAPEDVGRHAEELVLGRHSGRAAVAAAFERLGVTLEGDELGRMFDGFKELAGRRKRVFDDDLLTLLAEGGRTLRRRARLVDLHVVSGASVTPTATVKIANGADERTGVAVGDGPIDAALRAVGDALGTDVSLIAFQASAASPGRDAVGSVQLEIERAGERAVGRGASTDSVEAAARALLDALNVLETRDASEVNSEDNAEVTA